MCNVYQSHEVALKNHTALSGEDLVISHMQINQSHLCEWIFEKTGSPGIGLRPSLIKLSNFGRTSVGSVVANHMVENREIK